MSKLNIDQAILLQNPHWSGEVYKHPIKRLHDELAIRDLDLEEILIITGIRRCGKSTLMHTLINQLMLNQNPRSILYVNFDDPLYTALYQDASALYTLINHAEKLSGHKIQTLFLDEIQNVSAWEQYVKSVYDNRVFEKIAITGSNAELLKSDYANLLTGRYLEIHVYPLSFTEVLNYHEILEPIDLIRNKSEVLAHLDFFMKYGGFPRIHCVSDDGTRLRLLKNYYETIILKDCIKNHEIRDSKVFFNFSYYMINNLSATYSYNSLSRALSIHENTAAQYIHILECAYFLYELKMFSYSIKVQSKTKKKAYCIDNGIILAASFQFSQNLGKLFENLVYSELIKQNRWDIYFYNNKKECDFIVHGENKIAIQACYDLNEENKPRELAGLLEAMKEFKLSKGVIITYNQEEIISHEVSVVPFWKFFFIIPQKSVE
jgi:uncharacterized protein